MGALYQGTASAVPQALVKPRASAPAPAAAPGARLRLPGTLSFSMVAPYGTAEAVP